MSLVFQAKDLFHWEGGREPLCEESVGSGEAGGVLGGPHRQVQGEFSQDADVRAAASGWIRWALWGLLLGAPAGVCPAPPLLFGPPSPPPPPPQLQQSAGALSKPYLLPPGLGVGCASAGPVTVPMTSSL